MNSKVPRASLLREFIQFPVNREPLRRRRHFLEPGAASFVAELIGKHPCVGGRAPKRITPASVMQSLARGAEQ